MFFPLTVFPTFHRPKETEYGVVFAQGKEEVVDGRVCPAAISCSNSSNVRKDMSTVLLV